MRKRGFIVLSLLLFVSVQHREVSISIKINVDFFSVFSPHKQRDLSVASSFYKYILYQKRKSEPEV